MSYMKTQWQTTTLGECVQLISGGTPSMSKSDYWGGKIPWVSTKDMNSLRLYDTEDHITEMAVGHGAKVVPIGTVLIAVRGMRLAKSLPIVEVQQPVSFNQDLKAIKCRENILPRFLLYWLLAQEYQIIGRCDEAAHGTKRLQTDRLLSTEIELPPLSTQSRIAEIFSNYDDLIDNNTRRIALLEESIHRLYKEWFVYLRFPGCDRVKVVDGVPEGWKIGKLPELCSKVLDGTHDSPKPEDEGFYMVTGRHIIDGFIDFSKCYLISPQEHKKVMLRSRPEKGDIIFSNIGTLGSTVLVDQEFEFSIKNVALFKPLKASYSSFLYSFFSDEQTLQLMSQQASGTSQRFFSLKFLRNFSMMIPSEKLINQFDKVAKPILEQRSLLNKSNQKLHEARDLLLPRLMNGSIAV